MAKWFRRHKGIVQLIVVVPPTLLGAYMTWQTVRPGDGVYVLIVALGLAVLMGSIWYGLSRAADRIL